MANQTTLRLLESLRWPKKSAKTSDQIGWFTHRKRPQIKRCQGEKSLYLSQGCQYR